MSDFRIHTGSLLGLMLVLVSVVFSSSAWALNKSQSADWVKMLSRNATTEIDGTFYNPAGLAFLEGNGIHFSLSNIVGIQDKSIQDQSEFFSANGLSDPYQGKIRSYVFPDLHAAYHSDDWTLYLTFMPTGGGGGGEYDNGLPQFDAMILSEIYNAGITPSSYQRDMNFTGVSYNLGAGFGLAYQLNEMVSVAVGYRFTSAIREYSGSVTNMVVGIGEAEITGEDLPDMLSDAGVEVAATGQGHSIILGLHLRPIEGLDIGIHTELNGELEIENSTEFTGNPKLAELFSNTSFADGYKSVVTEAPMIAMGASYQLSPDLMVAASLFCSLNSQATFGGRDDVMKDSYFTSVGAEYGVSDDLSLGIGYAHDSGWLKPEYRSDLDFSLVMHYVSFGVTYDVTSTIEITTGAMANYAITAEDDTSLAPGGGLQTREEVLKLFTFGVAYHPAPG